MSTGRHQNPTGPVVSIHNVFPACQSQQPRHPSHITPHSRPSATNPILDLQPCHEAPSALSVCFIPARARNLPLDDDDDDDIHISQGTCTEWQTRHNTPPPRCLLLLFKSCRSIRRFLLLSSPPPNRNNWNMTSVLSASPCDERRFPRGRGRVRSHKARLIRIHPRPPFPPFPQKNNLQK